MQVKDISQEQEIKNVMTRQVLAWNRGDIISFMHGYWRSKELTFIGSRGVTKGWQATLESYQKAYPDRKTMGLLNFENLEVSMLSEDSAYMIGEWDLEREGIENLNGYFTLLWRLIDEEWVIVSDHTSTAKE